MATSTIQKETPQYYELLITTDTSSDYLDGYWYLERCGNTVLLQVDNMKNMPAGAFTETVKEIPEGYRPPRNKNYTLIRRTDASAVLALQVQSTGQLRFYNYSSADAGPRPYTQCISWLI